MKKKSTEKVSKWKKDRDVVQVAAWITSGMKQMMLREIQKAREDGFRHVSLSSIIESVLAQHYVDSEIDYSEEK